MNTTEFFRKKALERGMTLEGALRNIASSYYFDQDVKYSEGKYGTKLLKKPAKSPWYLKFVGRMPCCVCGRARDKALIGSGGGRHQDRWVNSVKVKDGEINKNLSDYRAIPICNKCLKDSKKMVFVLSEITESTQLRLLEIYLRGREGS